MYNWSIDEEKIKKDKKAYRKWKLEQLINFGLNGEKIRLDDLRKNFDQLVIDPHRRALLQLFLDEKHSH